MNSVASYGRPQSSAQQMGAKKPPAKGKAQQLVFAVCNPASCPHSGLQKKTKKRARKTLRKTGAALRPRLAQEHTLNKTYNTSARLLSRTMLCCIPSMENRMHNAPGHDKLHPRLYPSSCMRLVPMLSTLPCHCTSQHKLICNAPKPVYHQYGNSVGEGLHLHQHKRSSSLRLWRPNFCPKAHEKRVDQSQCQTSSQTH